MHSFAVGEIAIDRACPFKRIFIEDWGGGGKKIEGKIIFSFQLKRSTAQHVQRVPVRVSGKLGAPFSIRVGRVGAISTHPSDA